MEVRLENDWSCGLVPKQIASVLVRFITVKEPAVKKRDTAGGYKDC